jgi:3-oxoacyl-[acyl-carrier protein] reductase
LTHDHKEFAGRTALITGGGGGTIGGPTALAFAHAGADIVICDFHERRLNEWADRIRSETGQRVLAFHLDIIERPLIDRMVAATQEQLGSIDILICNACENILGKIVEYDPADWDRSISVGLSANFYLARKVLPKMVEKRLGTIVNIGSISAWIGDPYPNVGEAAYSVAKAGLLALTRNIAGECGPFGVRANAVAPGLIWSRFVEKYEHQIRRFKDNTPLRKYGESKDVVEAILFLASDRRAGFITGETLNVSGWYYMRP